MTLVVGSMIGSGIFIVSAKSSRVLGSGGWLLAAWAIAGLLTMIAALCCSELAALVALTVAGLLLGGGKGAALHAGGFWNAVSPDGRARAGTALAAALGTAMVGPLFSQSAWNNVTFAGEEVEKPGRTLPRALLAGCLLVTSLYVLANLAYLNVLPL